MLNHGGVYRVCLDSKETFLKDFGDEGIQSSHSRPIHPTAYMMSALGYPTRISTSRCPKLNSTFPAYQLL